MPQLIATFFRKRAKSIGVKAKNFECAQKPGESESVRNPVAQIDPNGSPEDLSSVTQGSHQSMTPTKSGDLSHPLRKPDLQQSQVSREKSLNEPQSSTTFSDDESKSASANKMFSPVSAFPVNDNQQLIVRDLTTALKNISVTEAFSAGVQNTSKGNTALLPSLTPLAYTTDMFQAFYKIQSSDPNSPIDRQRWNPKAIREQQEIRDIETNHNLELILDLFHPTSYPPIPKPPPRLRPFKLALFDMDSTLINEEVIDELARSIGVYDQVSRITERAMNDPSIDFATSLRARVALLKGVPASIWPRLQSQITIAAGARDLIAGLREHGIVTGVISGGFAPMAEWLKDELGLDLAFANHLCISPATAEYSFEHLTGELDLGEGKVIVTPDFKRATLIAEAEKRGIPLQETLAVGDGSNDLKMLAVAGLGVAWNAKAKTQEMAPMRLNGESLTELLYLLGPLREASMT